VRRCSPRRGRDRGCSNATCASSSSRRRGPDRARRRRHRLRVSRRLVAGERTSNTRLLPDGLARSQAGRRLAETRGAAAVAGQALGYAQLGLDLRPALINGVPGAVAFLHGQPFSIGAVTVRNGRIVELDFLADPERLRRLELTILDD